MQLLHCCDSFESRFFFLYKCKEEQRLKKDNHFLREKKKQGYRDKGPVHYLVAKIVPTPGRGYFVWEGVMYFGGGLYLGGGLLSRWWQRGLDLKTT